MMVKRADEFSATVLVVDDNPTNLGLLVEYLKEFGYKPLIARDGETALNRVRLTKPDLILLDVMMPGMDGLEVCRQLQADPLTREIPVIFMTALAGSEDKLRGFEAGGVDYLTKPIQQAEVLARLQTHLRLRHLTLSLREQNERLELSNQIGQQISTILELEPLLQRVLSMLSERFKSYFVGVWLVEEMEEEFTLLAYSAPGGARPFSLGYRLPFSAKPSIIAEVYRTQQMYLANDTTQDGHFLAIAELPETQSELTLPLRVGEEIIGVLDLHGNKVNAFTAEDWTVLNLISNQIAAAIRNAQLYRQSMRFNDDLARLVAQSTEELRQAYDRLEKIDRAKSDFIEVAAHELRTPITVMKGYAQVLESRLKNDEQSLSLLGQLLSGIQRLNTVVNSMLDIARVDADVVKVGRTQVRIVDMILKAQGEFAEAMKERQISFVTHDLNQLPYLKADPDLLYKAFYHLIINAIKYTPDGGTITVSGAVTPAPGPHSQGIEIQVQDSGIGIDPGNLEAVFEKFFQTGSVALHSSGLTKFKGGGTGLGLSIARGIIQAHQGRIWATSPGYDEEKLPGSTFHVWLPLEEALT